MSGGELILWIWGGILVALALGVYIPEWLYSRGAPPHG